MSCVLIDAAVIAKATFGPEEILLFHPLAPHVVRTTRTSDIPELRTVEAERLTAVLDQLATAIWLVDKGEQVLHANASAQAPMLRTGPLRVVRERLTMLQPAEACPLAATIHEAAMGEFSDTPAPQATLPLGDAAREGLIATMLPLRGGG